MTSIAVCNRSNTSNLENYKGPSPTFSKCIKSLGVGTWTGIGVVAASFMNTLSVASAMGVTIKALSSAEDNVITFSLFLGAMCTIFSCADTALALAAKDKERFATADSLNQPNKIHIVRRVARTICSGLRAEGTVLWAHNALSGYPAIDSIRSWILPLAIVLGVGESVRTYYISGSSSSESRHQKEHVLLPDLTQKLTLRKLVKIS